MTRRHGLPGRAYRIRRCATFGAEHTADAPPYTASFQGTAELLPNDHPEIVALVANGRLAAVTSHGELERPGTCFVKFTPSGRVTTYGIGISDDAIAADLLSAFGAVAR